jgi:diguanylate cyclase (GGDEF)-like protein
MAPVRRVSTVPTPRRRTNSGRQTRPPLTRVTPAAAPPDLASRLRSVQPRLRRELNRPAALIDVVRAVNSTLDSARIAELVVGLASSWIPAPCWAIVSADNSGQLSVLADRGLEANMAGSIYAVAQWVRDSGAVFVTNNLSRDSRVTGVSTASVFALPLDCRGQHVGALVGLDPVASSHEPRLPPPLLKTLQVLLEPAAVALDNAVLLERAEALSVTDDLTHLFNSRFLHNVLRRETKRAHRSARPLSVLFVDLDGFKTVNDVHGHLCGSRALVEVATVIKASARETDVAARFGGDEFVLVLPETGAPGAYAAGERVRDRIAAHRFLAEDGLDVHLTASVGVATLPDVAESGDDLLSAADRAMYEVKDRGKNGIQAARPPADK